MNNMYISEIVATRLPHDLIGNIGAVANAVEIMNEGDEQDFVEVKNILDFSSKLLSNRLKFFRLCFGLSGATVKTTDDLKKIIADYLATLGNPNFPTTLQMDIETPQVYKIVMPSVMMMADTLVKGGKIAVKQNEHNLSVQALSEIPLNQAKLKNIDAVLQGNKVEENPSTYAPLYYLIGYLKGCDVLIKRVDNALIIGE